MILCKRNNFYPFYIKRFSRFDQVRFQPWMKERFHVNQVFLTTSCTHALEMAAFLCDIHPGDEVIMPSYTFVSTADAFVLRGAKIVFVDIRPDTMNIDEKLIESAITEKTKAIVPVHYAGVACEMDTIMEIARKYDLKVVEDAAQGVEAYYHGKALGTIGDFGCYSFHETKNYTMGEGGALVFQDNSFQEKAEILREKGTDRSKFFRGQVDKYRWIDYGSSYLPSEMNAVVDFIKEHNDAVFDENLKNEISFEKQEENAHSDAAPKGKKNDGGLPPEVFKALRMGLDGSPITISGLQRKLGLGFPKAAKIVDIMSEHGFIAISDEDKKHRVCISEEEIDALENGGGEDEDGSEE